MYSTYDQVGKAEDVSDIITDITPTDTPMFSLMRSEKVAARTFEWMEDSLASAADNKAIEGADASMATLSPTTLRSNNTQILTKAFQVSATADAIKTAVANVEIGDEDSEQLARRKINRAVLSLDDRTLSPAGREIYKTLGSSTRAELAGKKADDIEDSLKNAAESAQIKKLAGIYTISFLSVMALFGLGNVLLKVKRAGLPRPAKAKWISVIIAISAVLCGLIGNAMIDSRYVWTFFQYFIPSMLVVGIMLGRITLLKATLSGVRTLTASVVGPLTSLTKWVREQIDKINAQQIVFFTRGDNIANLNNALLYVRQNEHTNRLKIVLITNHEIKVPEKLSEELDLLDRAYPEIDVEFVTLEGNFSPELIQKLSEEWNIPKNLMFIGSPGGRLPYDLAELGGVRLII